MNNTHYVLITQGSCNFCKSAIELLRERDEKFIYTDMEHAPDILEVTKVASGHSTVPMIWEVSVGEDLQQPAANKFIGGLEELQEHLGLSNSQE